MTDNREPLGTTWGVRYFNTAGVNGEDADSFDFSDSNPDDGVPAATLLLPYFEVSTSGDYDEQIEVEYFFGNPDDVPLAEPTPSTTFDDDFIA